MKRVLFAILLGMALYSYASANADELVVTFGGDCVLGTREEWQADEQTFNAHAGQYGLGYPFSGLEDVFKNDDMTLLNLECVLQDGSQGHDHRKQHTFRGKPEYAQMLSMAGVEQVNLANNHTVDYRNAGKQSTMEALAEAGVEYSGNQRLYIWEKNGHKIGFGGCRETDFKANKALVYRDIQKLKEQGCDVIVYSCHWGKEYSPTHNAGQERMAQYAANSGADIVVGTHPHVVQGVEWRERSDKSGGAVILYSLGNLVFGGTHDMKTFDGLLAQATLSFDGQGGYLGADIRLIPVLTSGSVPENDFCPVPAAGGDAERILNLVQADSAMPIAENLRFGKPLAGAAYPEVEIVLSE